MSCRLLFFVLCMSLTACASRQCLDTSVSAPGAALFRINCAGCHGTNARGNGPIAEYINAPVPDLTHISARNGGEFPAERVYRTIDGQSGSSVHGARHMPVWGYEFFEPEANDTVAHQNAIDKVDRLVAYLRTIQESK